jgi:hypothetical protein
VPPSPDGLGAAQASGRPSGDGGASRLWSPFEGGLPAGEASLSHTPLWHQLAHREAPQASAQQHTGAADTILSSKQHSSPRQPPPSQRGRGLPGFNSSGGKRGGLRFWGTGRCEWAVRSGFTPVGECAGGSRVGAGSGCWHGLGSSLRRVGAGWSRATGAEVGLGAECESRVAEFEVRAWLGICCGGCCRPLW